MNLSTHYVAGLDRDGVPVFYTGKAGEAFTSTMREHALVAWRQAGAEATAARLNLTTRLHGIAFVAMPADLPNCSPGEWVDPSVHYEAAAQHCARQGYSDPMLVRALIALPEQTLADIEADPPAFAQRVREYAAGGAA